VADSIIETGISFVATNDRWMKHTVGLDIDYVRGHLGDPAGERFDELPLLQKVLVVRAVTELSVCRFRQTRKDPDYTPQDYAAWVKVIEHLIGLEGSERLGL
jgi:hypothetical protein